MSVLLQFFFGAAFWIQPRQANLTITKIKKLLAEDKSKSDMSCRKVVL